MHIKLVEIRDEGTTIPAVAIKTAATNEAEAWLLSRAGYGGEEQKQGGYILLAMIDGSERRTLEYDPYEWRFQRGGSRTMEEAHRWLQEHFDEIESGDVVDVQFVLGETELPKMSDRFRERRG